MSINPIVVYPDDLPNELKEYEMKTQVLLPRLPSVINLRWIAQMAWIQEDEFGVYYVGQSEKGFSVCHEDGMLLRKIFIWLAKRLKAYNEHKTVASTF